MHTEKYRQLQSLHRPVSRHPSMGQAQRAKQFAPFSALRGLETAINDCQKKYYPLSSLSPERKEELDNILQTLTPGTFLSVSYFSPKQTCPELLGTYCSYIGVFQGYDTQKTLLCIGTHSIPICFLYQVTAISDDIPDSYDSVTDQ